MQRYEQSDGNWLIVGLYEVKYDKCQTWGHDRLIFYQKRFETSELLPTFMNIQIRSNTMTCPMSVIQTILPQRCPSKNIKIMSCTKILSDLNKLSCRLNKTIKWFIYFIKLIDKATKHRDELNTSCSNRKYCSIQTNVTFEDLYLQNMVITIENNRYIAINIQRISKGIGR